MSFRTASTYSFPFSIVTRRYCCSVSTLRIISSLVQLKVSANISAVMVVVGNGRTHPSGSFMARQTICIRWPVVVAPSLLLESVSNVFASINVFNTEIAKLYQSFLFFSK